MRIRLAGCLMLATVTLATGAHGQAERVDPQTGNYYNYDPLNKDAPDADSPNPNRVESRQSPNGGKVVTPGDKDLGQTAQADSTKQAMVTRSPVFAQPLVPMGDMPMYSPPGTQAQDDTFALPDWWPK